MDTYHHATPIIPISKLLGNYNCQQINVCRMLIIPISKLLGNYNTKAGKFL